MAEVAPPDTRKPTPGMGVGVYLLAGPAVVCLAGLGGHFGERLGGGPGYWVGCYVAGIAAAASVGLLFARLFRGHPLYWALGALGLLVGGHLTWFALGGKASEAPVSGSDQLLIALASLVGLLLGFAAAHTVVARRGSAPDAEPGAAADGGGM